MTTAQKVAGGVDSVLAKAEETGSVSAGAAMGWPRAPASRSPRPPRARARAPLAAPAQNVAQAFTGAPEPPTAQKAAGGIDLLVKKAEDAAGSVADLMKGKPEPTTAQKVAGGVDSALAQAKETGSVSAGAAMGWPRAPPRARRSPRPPRARALLAERGAGVHGRARADDGAEGRRRH